MIASDIQALGERLKNEIGRGVIGQHAAVDLMLIALLSKGHLLADVPAILGSIAIVFGEVDR